MSDPWVSNAQTWINTAYASVSGVPTVTVNGQTGWPTMYALTRALQHELEFSTNERSDTFGDGTYGELIKYGNIGPTPPLGSAGADDIQQYRRLVKIIQAAMYCKGYNGGNGDIDGIWSTTTTAGITKLRSDMGISTTNKTVSPKVFKALLNMDAYVLVDGGSSTIRAIQRELNTKYAGPRRDFYIIPTDGFYSRDVQRGMMYAIQYEIGMTDSVANGNFGPGTQEGLGGRAAEGKPGVGNFGVGSSGSFLIKLYQAALIFNGFPVSYGGSFTENTAAVTREFQAFCKLSVTGRSDFRTWASLLVSTGDTKRPGTALDTIATITPTRTQTLKAAGYTTVGRYLTNTPVADPLDKNIKPGEIQTIIAAGMKIFPIFQEGGTGLNYFTYDQGFNAAKRANTAANGYGFNQGTTIYYAVDFDALEDEVYSHIVPYFQGVNDANTRLGGKYRVGVYGSRNTCSIVSNRGLATLSFVSGMSTGFSGNLGFPLPKNWAFDQILEYALPDNDGDGNADVSEDDPRWVNLDKDIQSGRDAGQSSVSAPTTTSSYDRTLEFITWIDSAAITPPLGSAPVSRRARTMRQLRSYNAQYAVDGSVAGVAWEPLGGPIDPVFKNAMAAKYPEAKRPVSFKADADARQVVEGIDWPHMMASATALDLHGVSKASDRADFADFGGWAGDLTSLVAAYLNDPDFRTLGAGEFARQALNGSLPETSFDDVDLQSDALAYLLIEQLNASGSPYVSPAVQVAFNLRSMSGRKFSRAFALSRFGNQSVAVAVVRDALSRVPKDDMFLTYRTAFWLKEGWTSAMIPYEEIENMVVPLVDAMFK